MNDLLNACAAAWPEMLIFGIPGFIAGALTERILHRRAEH